MNLEAYRALHDRAGWVDREDRGRLWIRGDDRRTYLHNLLTNDIQELSAGEVRYAALLTPQGRMITDMHVFERGDSILMTLPRTLTAMVGDRFEQFIFSEDVTVEDASAATIQAGVYGPQARAVLDALPRDVILASMTSDEFGLAGFEVIADATARTAVTSALARAGAIEADLDTAEVCRVEAGVPRFLVDMTEDTIPLEAGIEDRAISLTKGCYVGQEIIIRVLHRGGGRVARRLVMIGFAAGARVPAAGAALYSNDRQIGAVTSATESPAFGRPIALGYVHRDSSDPGSRLEVQHDDRSRAAGEVLRR